MQIQTQNCRQDFSWSLKSPILTKIIQQYESVVGPSNLRYGCNIFQKYHMGSNDESTQSNADE